MGEPDFGVDEFLAQPLTARVATPAVALVVDACDLVSGQARQVTARGEAELLPFGVPRGRRLLRRYLGPDEARWDARFRQYLHGGPVPKGTVWLRVPPRSLTAADLSYTV